MAQPIWKQNSKHLVGGTQISFQCLAAAPAQSPTVSKQGARLSAVRTDLAGKPATGQTLLEAVISVNTISD